MTSRGARLTSLDDLVATGLLSPSVAPTLVPVVERYALAITGPMAALIEPGRADDPIARQFIPSPLELRDAPGERADPIGDEAWSPVRGIVHRYPDRVLLKLTALCPVYCRFCFRREMIGPGAGGELSARDLDQALAFIGAHTDIFEVILTGGDPLALSARRIREVTDRLAAIPHVRVRRWHSRVPVVSPASVTDAMIEALCGPGGTVFIGVHANHPREITPAAQSALRRLAEAGIGLVSQTVLLRGVNDDPTVLAELMRAFLAARVKPYYLHHPDLAPGTGHFRLSIAEGQAIVGRLRGRLSGLAQPTYVLDIPGGAGKVPIGPGYVDTAAGTVSDWQGRVHRYPPSDDGGTSGER